MAAENSGADAPLKLLSLGTAFDPVSNCKQSFLNSLADGGGIRGISTLIVLKYLMKRINPTGPPPKPCDYFNLIGGTSTGGYAQKPRPRCNSVLTPGRIIAIMLGRLRMDVQTCIDKYIELSSAAFVPKRSKVNFLSKLKDKWEVNGTYRADVLVKEMRQAVQDNLEDKDPEAKLFDPNPACKV